MGLRDFYVELKRAYMREQGLSVPERYHSMFVSFGGAADQQYVLKHLLQNRPSLGNKALVVGVFGGRDYFLLKALGYDVTGVDLGEVPEIDNLVFANVEEGLPFDDDAFDIIVLGEILEHLREDATALEHVHRVLRPEGVLVVTVPFFHDTEPGHIRIHSPKSIRRLLSIAGFAVTDYIERPALVNPNIVNGVQVLASALTYKLTGKTAFDAFNRALGYVTVQLGRQQGLAWLRRHQAVYGATLACVRVDNKEDHIAINKRDYTEASASA